MAELVFSRDIAALAAQVAPVLVVAFVVEVRALGERRRFADRDAKVLVFLVFGSLFFVLAAAAAALVGPDTVYGWAAFWNWTMIGLPTLALIALVAIAAWTGLSVSTIDGDEERRRQRRLDSVVAEPGWRWFLRGQRDTSAGLHNLGPDAERR